jgi:two-component system chemotaxis response regulator CheB
MAHSRDLLVIGGSAGGFDALYRLVRALPPGLHAAVCVVIHTGATQSNLMAEILNAAGGLPVHTAVDGMAHAHGNVYIAPPNRHLLVNGSRLVLGTGPRESRARPAIDPLFRSAAVSHGPRAVGLLLSGTMDDGTSGLMAIKRGGGVTVVQSPADAAFPEMPENAVRYAAPHHVAPLSELSDLLVRLIGETAIGDVKPMDDVRMEAEVAAGKPGLYAFEHLGKPSFFACPDCHGVMHEIGEGDFLRYRCHVGHTYTAAALGGALDQDLWQALSSALRALEERQVLLQRMAQQAQQTGAGHSAREFAARATEYAGQAETVRRVLQKVEDKSSEGDAAAPVQQQRNGNEDSPRGISAREVAKSD